MNLPPDYSRHQHPEIAPDSHNSRSPAPAEQNDVDVKSPARDSGGCTMRDVLRESIGYYVICQHLIGASCLVYKEGLLTRVESNCFTLYDEDNRTCITCDYFSLKIFQRYPRNERPPFKISQIMQDLELARIKSLINCNTKR